MLWVGVRGLRTIAEGLDSNSVLACRYQLKPISLHDSRDGSVRPNHDDDNEAANSLRVLNRSLRWMQHCRPINTGARSTVDHSCRPTSDNPSALGHRRHCGKQSLSAEGAGWQCLEDRYPLNQIRIWLDMGMGAIHPITQDGDGYWLSGCRHVSEKAWRTETGICTRCRQGQQVQRQRKLISSVSVTNYI
jgi:hypothetical protein